MSSFENRLVSDLSNHKERCADSLKRYGRSFAELHRWMDEPCTLLGASHRKYRHDPNVTPAEAKAIFGELADHACLDHIRLDEIEARKNKCNDEPSDQGILVTPVRFSVQSPAGTWMIESDAVNVFENNQCRFDYVGKSFVKRG